MRGPNERKIGAGFWVVGGGRGLGTTLAVCSERVSKTHLEGT
jgi:hypothetical protein